MYPSFIWVQGYGEDGFGIAALQVPWLSSQSVVWFDVIVTEADCLQCSCGQWLFPKPWLSWQSWDYFRYFLAQYTKLTTSWNLLVGWGWRGSVKVCQLVGWGQGSRSLLSRWNNYVQGCLWNMKTAGFQWLWGRLMCSWWIVNSVACWTLWFLVSMTAETLMPIILFPMHHHGREVTSERWH